MVEIKGERYRIGLPIANGGDMYKAPHLVQDGTEIEVEIKVTNQAIGAPQTGRK